MSEVFHIHSCEQNPQLGIGIKGGFIQAAC